MSSPPGNGLSLCAHFYFFVSNYVYARLPVLALSSPCKHSSMTCDETFDVLILIFIEHRQFRQMFFYVFFIFLETLIYTHFFAFDFGLFFRLSQEKTQMRFMMILNRFFPLQFTHTNTLKCCLHIETKTNLISLFLSFFHYLCPI